MFRENGSNNGTTAINETTADFGTFRAQFIEGGNLKPNINKWIHHFDAVLAVVFVVDLSSYDQGQTGDLGCNGITESLVFFNSMCKSKWFQQASIILLLNKVDLFREKLVSKPLRDYMPEYTGGEDPKEAEHFLMKLFVQADHSRDNIRVSSTIATNPRSTMDFVRTAITAAILDENVKLLHP